MGLKNATGISHTIKGLRGSIVAESAKHMLSCVGEKTWQRLATIAQGGCGAGNSGINTADEYIHHGPE